MIILVTSFNKGQEVICTNKNFRIFTALYKDLTSVYFNLDNYHHFNPHESNFFDDLTKQTLDKDAFAITHSTLHIYQDLQGKFYNIEAYEVQDKDSKPHSPKKFFTNKQKMLREKNSLVHPEFWEFNNYDNYDDDNDSHEDDYYEDDDQSDNEKTTERATDKQIKNTLSLFLEYLNSLSREKFIELYFSPKKWFTILALQDFQAWMLGATESKIKHMHLTDDESLIFEIYLKFEYGCGTKYDYEMIKTFTQVCDRNYPTKEEVEIMKMNKQLKNINL